MENFNNPRRFFENFKSLTFWQRLFSWNNIRALSYAAYEDFIQLSNDLRNNHTDLETLKHDRDLLLQEKSSMQRQLADTRERFVKFDPGRPGLQQSRARIAFTHQSRDSGSDAR